MQNFKRLGFMVTMATMGFAFLAGEAMAYSDAYFSIGGGTTAVKFTASGTGVTGSTFYFSNNSSSLVYTANIPQQGGTTEADPLVGSYVSIVGNFTIGTQTSTSGVYNVNQTAAIKISSTVGGSGVSNVDYFVGTVTLTTIDMNTGYIQWEITDTAVTVNNASLSSEILSILGNSDNDAHYAIIGNMSFTNLTNISSALRGNTVTTKSGSYSADITVSPEPDEWFLIFVGLGLISLALYRRKPQASERGTELPSVMAS